MSLKAELYSQLKFRGYLTLDAVHSIAKEMGKKESNAERTLRPSNSGTFVETDYDDKGQVKGYKWLCGIQINENVYSEEEIKRRKDQFHNPKML